MSTIHRTGSFTSATRYIVPCPGAKFQCDNLQVPFTTVCVTVHDQLARGWLIVHWYIVTLLYICYSKDPASGLCCILAFSTRWRSKSFWPSSSLAEAVSHTTRYQGLMSAGGQLTFSHTLYHTVPGVDVSRMAADLPCDTDTVLGELSGLHTEAVGRLQLDKVRIIHIILSQGNVLQL